MKTRLGWALVAVGLAGWGCAQVETQPGATESATTPPSDDPNGDEPCTDQDGDGYFLEAECGPVDCDDSSPGLYQQVALHADSDGDGFGAVEAEQLCVGDQLPVGYTENADDCDDQDPNAYVAITAFIDGDKDGYGAGAGSIHCTEGEAPAGYSLFDNDCDDNDPNSFEFCDSCVDADGDGYYAHCDAYVTLNGPDCNDAVEFPLDWVTEPCQDPVIPHQPADENSVFVNGVSGDDANSGSKSQPLKTISAGLAAAATDGDKVAVAVAGGDYTAACFIDVATSIIGGFGSNWAFSKDAPATRVTFSADPSFTVAPGAAVALYRVGIYGPQLDQHDCVTAIVQDAYLGLAGSSIKMSYCNQTVVGLQLQNAEVYGYHSGIISGSNPATDKLIAVELVGNSVVDFVVTGMQLIGLSPGTDPYPEAQQQFGMVVGPTAEAKVSGSRFRLGEAHPEGVGLWSEGKVFMEKNVYFSPSPHKFTAIALFNAKKSVFIDNMLKGYQNNPGDYTALLANGVDELVMVNNYINHHNNDTARGMVINDADDIVLLNNLVKIDDANGGLGIEINNATNEAVVVNNVVDVGGETLKVTGSSVYLHHNDLFSASCLVNASGTVVTGSNEVNACAWAGCSSAAGNISKNPNYVYELNGPKFGSSNNSLIDAGVAGSLWYAHTLDYWGISRPQGAAWDIGPVEYEP